MTGSEDGGFAGGWSASVDDVASSGGGTFTIVGDAAASYGVRARSLMRGAV